MEDVRIYAGALLRAFADDGGKRILKRTEYVGVLQSAKPTVTVVERRAMGRVGSDSLWVYPNSEGLRDRCRERGMARGEFDIVRDISNRRIWGFEVTGRACVLRIL